MTVIIFIIVLAVLIFVHELGHFALAKWNGIRVDEFKIGFGPRLIQWGRGETKYGLNLIPFGGFVRIHGENPDSDSIDGPDKDRSFVNKKRWQQAAVLIAGVGFNFIFAWLLYVIVFASGVTASTEGFEKYSGAFKDPRVMVTYVTPDSPAAKAGLKEGDIILDVKGAATSTVYKQGNSAAIAEIQDVVNASGGQTVSVEIRRGNAANQALTVKPEEGLVGGRYAIGIAMSDVVDLKLPFFSAIYEGAHYSLVMIRDTAIGIYTFVANIFRGTANFSDVAGPIGIAGIVGNAAEMGLTYLLMVTALISVNLGVINLVPFPALDGGRILVVAIEGIIRRRISPFFVNIVNAVGFGLLMILMIIVTYKDIAKLLK